IMRLSFNGQGPVGRCCVRTFTAILLLGMPVCLGRADAGFIFKDVPGYEVTGPDGVTPKYDPNPGTFPDNPRVAFGGTLTVTATFKTNDPITIRFTQVGEPRGFGATGGLRLAFESTFTNGSPEDWSGFTYKLTDFTVIDPRVIDRLNQDAHLGVAHFHPEADPIPRPADGSKTYTTTAFSVLEGVDNRSSIVLGSGNVTKPNG